MKLQEAKSWATGISHGLTSNSHLAQDIAQEMLIEAWQAGKIFDDTKGERIPFIKQRARWRALALLSGRAHYEGNKNFNRRRYLAKDTPVDMAMYDVPHDPGTSDTAYHSQEIHDALGLLSPKQKVYVYYRFWLGYTETDMIKIFGYHPNGLWKSPRNGAMFKLQQALGHLKEAP